MNNDLLLNRLQSIKSANNNIELLDDLILSIKNEIIQNAAPKSKKQAIKKIQAINKKLRDNIKGNKLINGFYYWTDSFVMIKSKEQLLELHDDSTVYPFVEHIEKLALSNTKEIDPKTINYGEICLKLKEDKTSSSIIGEGIIIANKYLKLAFDYFNESIRIYANFKNNVHTPILITDDFGDLMIIAQQRRQ